MLNFSYGFAVTYSLVRLGKNQSRAVNANCPSPGIGLRHFSMKMGLTTHFHSHSSRWILFNIVLTCLMLLEASGVWSYPATW